MKQSPLIYRAALFALRVDNFSGREWALPVAPVGRGPWMVRVKKTTDGLFQQPAGYAFLETSYKKAHSIESGKGRGGAFTRTRNMRLIAFQIDNGSRLKTTIAAIDDQVQAVLEVCAYLHRIA